MELTKELKIYKDAQELMRAILLMKESLRRDLKVTLGDEMFRRTVVLTVNITEAHRTSDLTTREYHINNILLEETIISTLFDTLIHMPFATVGSKPRARIYDLLANIGRQANGWKKSTQGMCR